MTLLLALLLVAVLLAGWGLTLVGAPGNWLMVIATAMYVFFVPAGSPVAIGWTVVVALIVLATLGEILELVAAAAGTARAGGSKRGAVLALLGSITGGVLGIVIGMPIPLFGSLVAALLFAGLGAMAGAILGEFWAGNKLDASWQIGQAAFWGRLLGTLGKLIVGAMMIALVVAALVL
jgi:uncharacterized protein